MHIDRMNIVNKRLLTLLLSSSLLSLSSFAADESEVDQESPQTEETGNSSESPESATLIPIDSKESTEEASAVTEDQSATPPTIEKTVPKPPVIDQAAKETIVKPAAVETTKEPVEITSEPPSNKDQANKEITAETLADASALQPLLQLIAENKFTLAYHLGLTLQNDWEGDEQFDFNFALAAAQTAHYNEAIFPFSRLLETYPNNLRFRLELARCHFFLNNLNAAEREFKQVSASNPPAEVQGHIHRFLTRIEEKKQQVTRSWNAGTGLTLGYDSNINAAADLDAIEATFYQNDSPALTGVLTLEDEQKSQASSYYQLRAYGLYQQPLSKRTNIDASITASMKDNSIDDSYDLTNLGFSAGFRMLRSNHNLRFGGTARQYWLAGESLQNQLLANVRWQWYFAPQWKTSAEFEAGQQDSEQNDALDFNQWQGKAALNRNAGGLVQSFQLGIGSDLAKDKINKFQGRDYYAFSYQAQQELSHEQQMYALLNYRTNRYSAAFADDHIFFAGETREDQLIQLIAGWVYQFMPNTSAKLQVSHSQNQSNLELYDYQRTLIETGLTISFK